MSVMPDAVTIDWLGKVHLTSIVAPATALPDALCTVAAAVTLIEEFTDFVVREIPAQRMVTAGEIVAIGVAVGRGVGVAAGIGVGVGVGAAPSVAFNEYTNALLVLLSPVAVAVM